MELQMCFKIIITLDLRFIFADLTGKRVFRIVFTSQTVGDDFPVEKIDEIPLSLSRQEVEATLGFGDLDEIDRLLDVAFQLIHARAVYEVCRVQERLKGAVIIDVVQFESRVLRKKLDRVELVFPYILTIGDQLEKWTLASGNPRERSLMDAIGNLAQNRIRAYLKDLLSSRYDFGLTCYMSPGCLKDWPIEKQKGLFSLFGNVNASIGVTLGDNFFTTPGKSMSGIFFPSETPFHYCQLCPIKDCPSRKEDYDRALAKEYGI